LRLRLGDQYLAAGKHNNAIDEYQLALLLDVRSPHAYLKLGQAMRAAGNTEKAVEHIEQALAMHPQWGKALYTLGLSYRDLGNETLAKKYLSQYELHKKKSPDPRDPILAEVYKLDQSSKARLRKAGLFAKKGKISKALSEYNKLLQVNPQSTAAHTNLIKLYRIKNDIPAAEKHYQAAISRNPNSQSVILLYAELLASTDRIDGAIEQLEKLIQINPQHANALTLLGAAYEDKKQPDKAIGIYRKALDADPKSARTNYLLGRRLVLDGKKPAAEPFFTASIKHSTRNPAGSLKRIGDVYNNIKDFTKARTYYMRAVDLAVNNQSWKLVAILERSLRKLDAINCAK